MRPHRTLAQFMRLQAVLLAIGYPTAAAWGLTTGWHTVAGLSVAAGLWTTARRLDDFLDDEEDRQA